MTGEGMKGCDGSELASQATTCQCMFSYLHWCGRGGAIDHLFHFYIKKAEEMCAGLAFFYYFYIKESQVV